MKFAMNMTRIFGVLLAIVTSSALILVTTPPAIAGLADISNADASSGLRQALADGSAAAVKLLGAENGYFGNAKYKTYELEETPATSPHGYCLAYPIALLEVLLVVTIAQIEALPSVQLADSSENG